MREWGRESGREIYIYRGERESGRERGRYKEIESA